MTPAFGLSPVISFSSWQTSPTSFITPLRTSPNFIQSQPARRIMYPFEIKASASEVATDSSRRRPRPGERKGFVEEMRFVAMRLHTKDQAPREGEQEASALPIDKWSPQQKDFMQFLIDSRAVYQYFEQQLAAPQNQHPIFSKFTNTGLERVDALDKDIAFLNNLGVDTPLPTTAATNYVDYLKNLLNEKPESVLCHWYNYYFAHSAGGRMIGRLMQDKLFGGKQFAFYEWETDVKEILGEVRTTIDQVAAEWPRDTKDECLKETSLAFGYSGTVLQNLAKAAN